MAVTQTARACDSGHFRCEGRPGATEIAAFLYQLEKAGQINPETRIIGVGRADWDKAAYTKVVREALETFMKEKSMKVYGRPSAVVWSFVIWTSMIPPHLAVWVKCWIRNHVPLLTISRCRQALWRNLQRLG